MLSSDVYRCVIHRGPAGGSPRGGRGRTLGACGFVCGGCKRVGVGAANPPNSTPAGAQSPHGRQVKERCSHLPATTVVRRFLHSRGWAEATWRGRVLSGALDSGPRLCVGRGVGLCGPSRIPLESRSWRQPPMPPGLSATWHGATPPRSGEVATFQKASLSASVLGWVQPAPSCTGESAVAAVTRL